MRGRGTGPPTMKVPRIDFFPCSWARGVDFSQVRVIDMFAGSGSLGIECLSRGAADAWFVEKSSKAAGLIRKNLADLNVEKHRARVVSKDLFGVLSQTAGYCL